MLTTLLVVPAAAALSFALIVLLRPLLVRYALALPNARSSHRSPTPQGGGIAVVIATIAISALAAWTLDAGGIMLTTLYAAAAFLAVVGTADDIWNIPAAPRLVLQALAVAAVIAALGDLRAMPMLPLWLERAVLFLAGLWFVNLVNFMDGLDWMTISEVVPVTGALSLLGLFGLYPVHAMLLALALLGAMLGFAPFNRPVAKLFLGDVGSLPIGLLLGALLFVLAAQGHLAAAIILPLYYIADATVTLLRRAARREPVWKAHRAHFYQQATDQGFSCMQVIWRVFAVNVGLVAIAAVTIAAPGLSWPGLGVATILAGGLLWKFSRPAQRPA